MDNPNTLIDMVDEDGALTFDASLMATSGTIQHRGTLTFNDETWIGSGVDLQNSNNSQLVVNADVRIEDADWDWDSFGSARQITINSGGKLTTKFLANADDLWSANMYINGGELAVLTLDGHWGQNAGVIDVGPGATPSTITGSIRFEQTNGQLLVQSGGMLNFDTQSRWSQGTLEVDGFAYLNENVEFAGSSVFGNGTIIPTADVTVSDNTNIGVHRYVMNQANTTIEPGIDFTVDVGSIDFFPGGNDVMSHHDIHVNSGVFNVQVDSGKWRLGGSDANSAGILNLNNVGSGVPALQGSTLRTQGAGRVRVEGNASIQAPLELGPGTNGMPTTGLEIVGTGGNVNIITGGLTLDGGDIRDAIDRNLFDSSVTLFSSMTVSGDSTVDVEVFDWDGGVTTVTPDGYLRMLSGGIESFGTQKFDAQLVLNSGKAEVDLANHNSWIVGEVLALNNTSNKVPELSGDHVFIGDDNPIQRASLSIGGNGVSEISSPTTYHADSDLTIGSGATLRHRGATTFNSVNGSTSASFNGPGSLVLGGINTFNELTTLNMSGGTVDLDNSSFTALAPNDTFINSPVIITAAHMADYGKSQFVGTQMYSEMFISNEGLLSVQLDGVGNHWTVKDVGIIHYNGDASPTTFLSGDSINMNGTLNVSGAGAVSAQMNIAGTVNIATGGALQLGGGSLANPNRLVGGTIGGFNGVLSTWNNRDLLGFGTIESNIDFVGPDARLMADDGTLTLQGNLVNVGVLGTADADGVLHVSSPWNTSVADQVELLGGELTGAPITNSGINGIRGFGVVSANVINNTKIVAENGTLILNNPSAPGLGSGTLHASSGDLHVQYSLPTAATFQGRVTAEDNHEFFANQFQMNFALNGEIDLNGGTFRSNQATQFGGMLSTIGGLTSTIDNPNQFTFANTSKSQLNGDLQLLGVTRVENGATFTGTGDVINTPGSTLQLADGAVLGVDLVNQGMLTLGNSPGQGAAVDFMQTASGQWNLEIAGMGPTDFDNLLLSGAAQLGGQLEVTLLNNYAPIPGDEFTILASANGVTGTFDTLVAPTLGPGLEFQLSYGPQNVVLRVDEAIAVACDFTGDGMCDVNDLNAMQTLGPLTIGLPATGNELFDLNGDGNIDVADRNQWLEVAANENGLASPYQLGDANLDGVVDGIDFVAWNDHKFTQSLQWSDGDFTADGFIDGLDFVAWNDNKFTASDQGLNPQAVPEPNGLSALFLTLGFLGLAVRRHVA